MAVVSGKILYPAEYLNLVCGEAQLIKHWDIPKMIKKICIEKKNRAPLYWDLDNLGFCSHKINVVLVDCSFYNEYTGETTKKHLWFEVF